MSDELKPCPFCGKHSGYVYHDIDSEGVMARAGCYSCGVELVVGSVLPRNGETESRVAARLKAEARALWNRRADAPLPDDVGLSRIAARQITAAVMQVIANAPEGEIPDTVEVALPSLLKRLAPEACLPDDVRAAVEADVDYLRWWASSELRTDPISQKAGICLDRILTHLTPAPTTGQRKEKP